MAEPSIVIVDTDLVTLMPPVPKKVTVFPLLIVLLPTESAIFQLVIFPFQLEMSISVIPDAAEAENTGSDSLVRYPWSAWLPQLYAVFQLEELSVTTVNVPVALFTFKNPVPNPGLTLSIS